MRCLRLLLVLGLAAISALEASAQGTVAADSAVTPAPWVTRGDLFVIGAGAGIAFLAQKADLSVRREVRSAGWQDNGALEALEVVGDHWGGSAAVVTGLGLWGGGLWARNGTVAAVGLRGLEAITVSGVITKVLKAGFGRARPRVDSLDAWNVEFGRGWDNDHEAFPSGHSTAAFAFAAAVTSEVARRAPEQRWIVGAGTFALGGVTAYARMHADAHWLSDVTMGAAIGMASGWAVTRWHATRPGNRIDALLLHRRASPFVMRTPDGRTLVGATLAWR
jgi:membrane-associated phospholipid phosphatase